VLLDQLPTHSRLKARLSGDSEGNRWGAVEHLLASLLDMASVQRIEARVIGGDKKPPSFEALERPGSAARRAAAEKEAEQRVKTLLRRQPKGGPGG
jgi:hypothetical protein